MKSLVALTKRNIKLYFSDKGMFISSLITPLILLVLFATFLKTVYEESFISSSAIPLSKEIINGVVGGQLLSSLLAVSCVTVAFCCNLIMVQDKSNEAIKDINMTSVKKSVVALSYYIATLISTLIIIFITIAIGLVYLSITGWYLTFVDVLLIILDSFLLALFGTAFASVINVFLKTQGQMSACGTIVSSGYGFISGAYMPISAFSIGLQRVLSFLPSTYGTSLIRKHTLRGSFEELSNLGIPQDIIEKIKDSIDCNIYFFENKVSTFLMYLILILSILVLVSLYIFINTRKKVIKK